MAKLEEDKAKRTNGDGSVYYRKSDNRWCASLSLPSETEGKTRRVTRTVPAIGTQLQQEKAAGALLTRLKRELSDKGDIPTSILNVETWARKWLNEIAVKEVRPKTAASYRTTIEQYIIPAIGNRQLRKLTPDHVRQVETYVLGKGLSSRSAALAYQVLSLLLKSAMREGKTNRNVADLVNRPRTAKTELTVLTAAHGLKVLRTVTGWPVPLAIDRLASRWWAAFFTGARQGELLGLEWDRVDFERGTLDLSWQLQRLSWEHGCGPVGKDDEGKPQWPCQKKRGSECPSRKLTSPADWENRHLTGGLYLSRPKSEAGRRIIPLVSPLREMLELRQQASALEDNPHGLVWTQPNGRPVDPSRDNAEWHAILKLAGVPDARLHDARHTTASLLGKAGVPIATITKILGHSTAAMSREYMDVDISQTTDALTRMSALMIDS